MAHAWLSLQVLGIVAIVIGVSGLFGIFWGAIVGGVLAALIGEMKA